MLLIILKCLIICNTIKNRVLYCLKWINRLKVSSNWSQISQQKQFKEIIIILIVWVKLLSCITLIWNLIVVLIFLLQLLLLIIHLPFIWILLLILLHSISLLDKMTINHIEFFSIFNIVIIKFFVFLYILSFFLGKTTSFEGRFLYFIRTPINFFLHFYFDLI